MRHAKQMYHIFTASAIGILFYFLGFSSFIKTRFSIEEDIGIFFLPILLSIVVFIVYKVISRVNKPAIADPDKSSLSFLFYANTPIVGLLLGYILFLADATGFSNHIKILFIFIVSLAFTIIFDFTQKNKMDFYYVFCFFSAYNNWAFSYSIYQFTSRLIRKRRNIPLSQCFCYLLLLCYFMSHFSIAKEKRIRRRYCEQHRKYESTAKHLPFCYFWDSLFFTFIS